MCFAQGLGPAGDAKMYMSQVPDSQAWETERTWSVMCFVPYPSGDSTDDHLQGRIILIGWPGMSWFWDLVNLSTKLLLRLPLWVNLLTQPFSNRLHNKIVYLNFHVWHLESDMNIKEDSQRKW